MSGMENFADRYRGAAFLALILGTLILAVVIILPFLAALLWAVMLSILMFPMYRKLRRAFERKKWSEKGGATLASSITTMVTFLIICVPFVFIGIFLYIQVSSLIGQLAATGPQGGHTLDQFFIQLDQQITPIAKSLGIANLHMSDYVQQHSSEIVNTLRQPVSHAFGRIMFTGLSLVIALLTMFFMLRDGERLRQPAYELLPLAPERTEAILKRIGDTVYAVFIGTMLVAILQATLLGVGFAIAGVPNAFLFGLIAVFLCTIPLIGATIIYIPAALILIAQGNYWAAVGVVVLGLVVTKLDYILRPFLIGGRTSLHPIGIFFGILGGVLVFGPVGLVAGPMVLAVLLALQDVVRERVRGTAHDLPVKELKATGS
jgi:predicted PurR-regulated permease PerM